ncbi:MAG: acyl-CoA thioesterase [Porticoccaceae bacterium]|nr:acyl-CoA thioesterase [Pseudomonadales bacterium]MCP5172903.1 acyl-CoA thioesterase [Pseudomonadales bacterium]MCP5302377.1 acyl-CoA thioesterase [Pseudomonadales bacterium]
MSIINQPKKPHGELMLQTIAMPNETNINGDIFGGWLLSQMDIGGGILAGRRCKGRNATVAVSEMVFIEPVPVGAIVSCYCKIEKEGRTSVSISVEVWINIDTTNEPRKVTEGTFVFVAIDENGRPRPLPAI